MRFDLGRLAVAATLSLHATAASAAAEPPTYRPGDVFIFDDGRVEEVRAVEGDRVTWASRSGRTYLRDANPVVPILAWDYRNRVGARTIIGEPNRLWPLRPGASVRFEAVNVSKRQGSDQERRRLELWTCRVENLKSVTTPAGAFDAYPIVCDRFSENSMEIVERVTWDFAPDVGHYVRRESRDMRDGERDVFSLYAALPAREANPVRIEAVATEARDSRSSR